MWNIFSIFSTHTEDAVLDTPVKYFEVGYGVSIMASEYPNVELHYGNRVGTVESIELSPYYSEAQQGIERAYVVGSNFTDYCLLTDLMHHVA